MDPYTNNSHQTNDPKKEPQSPVPQERARQHVLLAARRFWASGNPEFANFGDVTVGSQPLVLHDLNGAPLFYEFELFDQERRVVAIAKAAASRVIGTPVPTIELGPRKWNPEQATQRAQDELRKIRPQASITSTEFTCYSYPKIGIRVMFEENGNKKSAIFDAADFSQVKRYGASELEGQTSYSFYEAIAQPAAKKHEHRYQLAEAELEAVQRQHHDALNPDRSARELGEGGMKFYTPITDLIHISFFSSKVIKYAPRCTPHDCFELRAQQTNVYCAVATGQMLLDFYRYYFSQADIAAAMNTGAGGTSNPDQVTGYETLSNAGLNATYDGTASWNEAKAEIDANRPLKSGIPGHARACAGWMRQNIFFIGQPPKYWLKIYDPWPWNADACAGGNVVWEDWDTLTHTNFIYLQHS